MMNNKNIKNKYNFGMTVIELIVVLAIFVMITGITIFNYGSFRSSTSLQNLSDDIALAIRKAQSSATGSQLKNSVSNGYGLRFRTSDTELELASNKQFLIFADTNANKIFDYTSNGACNTPTNECIEFLKITSADIINEIDVSTNIANDASLLTVNNTGSMDISFLRPNFDAYFCYKLLSTDPCKTTYNGNPISNVRIVIKNTQTGSFKYIKIWNTGQISVQ